MILTKLRSRLGSHLRNIKGWSSKNKIVVFESDDWGSIRMPSREVYKQLLRLGIRVDKLSYNRYDSLASEEDLLSLFEILVKYKDRNGRHPVFTANCVVANPDFKKIKAANYSEYFYEPFIETLKRYPKHSKSFSLWKEGLSNGIFVPQYHGREHLNVPRWLKALQMNTGDVRLAFKMNMFDLSESGSVLNENSFMDSLAYCDDDELKYINNSIIEGAELFKILFGFTSRSFIAPCFIWDTHQETTLANCGVKYIQGGLYQKCSIPGKINQYKRIKHYTGEHNLLGQWYTVRNCFFEPSDWGKKNYLNSCLAQIDASFYWNKPAIISTHRLNYIGYIEPENRIRNLSLLSDLLRSIIKKYPDVEFLSSSELGSLIGERRDISNELYVS